MVGKKSVAHLGYEFGGSMETHSFIYWGPIICQVKARQAALQGLTFQGMKRNNTEKIGGVRAIVRWTRKTYKEMTYEAALGGARAGVFQPEGTGSTPWRGVCGWSLEGVDTMSELEVSKNYLLSNNLLNVCNAAGSVLCQGCNSEQNRQKSLLPGIFYFRVDQVIIVVCHNTGSGL